MVILTQILRKKSQKRANYTVLVFVKTKRRRKRFLAPLAWDFNYFHEFCDSNETELYSKNKKFSKSVRTFCGNRGERISGNSRFRHKKGNFLRNLLNP